MDGRLDVAVVATSTVSCAPWSTCRVGPGDRAVVGEHAQLVVADPLDDGVMRRSSRRRRRGAACSSQPPRPGRWCRWRRIHPSSHDTSERGDSSRATMSCGIGIGCERAHVRAAGVADRVLTGDRARRGHQHSEDLAEGLVHVVVPDAAEHREVRADVGTGERLAQDVRSLEAGPLPLRVAVPASLTGCSTSSVHAACNRRGTPCSSGAGSSDTSGDARRECGAVADRRSDGIDEVGRCLGGGAGVERRLRVVLDGQLDHSASSGP